MIAIQKLRMPLDITMTALSVILMGGTVLFPDDKVHQILGMALIALWAVHIALNRRWYESLGKGRYNPYRDADRGELRDSAFSCGKFE